MHAFGNSIWERHFTHTHKGRLISPFIKISIFRPIIIKILHKYYNVSINICKLPGSEGSYGIQWENCPSWGDGVFFPPLVKPNSYYADNIPNVGNQSLH